MLSSIVNNPVNSVDNILIKYIPNFGQYVISLHNILMSVVIKNMNERFKEAYDGLPRKDSLQFQKELLEATGWSRSLFYMRLSGKRKLKADELPVLIGLFKKFDVNYWQ